nr:MAG TPA: hypothetical protein [Caudoviricetes sp.]
MALIDRGLWVWESVGRKKRSVYNVTLMRHSCYMRKVDGRV